MGLGSLKDYGLAEARERARQCRLLLNDGIDPIEHKRDRRRKAQLEAAKNIALGELRRRLVQTQRKKMDAWNVKTEAATF
jgi:hypothetical protein